MYSATGRILLQGPMRPVSVVMAGVLAQDQPQVPLTGNQYPVEALTAGAGARVIQVVHPEQGDDPG
jgi:hypothetical protein